MTVSLVVARILNRATLRIAPPSRAAWKTAMAGEFAAIDDGGQALSWASGCLMTAVGWRVLAEGPLIAGMVVAALGIKAVYLAWFWTADVSAASNWVATAGLLITGLVAAACALLTLMRPRRAWLIGSLFPLAYDGGQWIAFLWPALLEAPLSSSGNSPAMPTLVLGLESVVLQAAPGLAAALAVYGLIRLFPARKAHVAD